MRGRFLLSDTLAILLRNPDLAPLIKALSLAFIIIPHGQQYRALMQKELAFNKIGAIETVSVLSGFCVTLSGAWFWPNALMAIVGYLTNTLVRTLLFGFLGRKRYRPGWQFSLRAVLPNLKFGAPIAWLTM